MVYVSKDQIKRARMTNLGQFLMTKYPDEFQYKYENVVKKTNPRFSVGKNIPGYNDFLTGDHGNPIDFLMRYKNLGFTDAVIALNQFQDEFDETNVSLSTPKFVLPAHLPGEDLCCAVPYLLSKYISEDDIDMMVYEDTLYEDSYHNVVFVNKETLLLNAECQIRNVKKTT